MSFSQTPEEAIRKVLSDQQECWNKGDIQCFMQGYWKSEDLMFISRNGINYGWNSTLERYQKSYPSSEIMGKLRFDVVSLKPVGKNYIMIGKWNLDRTEDSVGGYFTLLWQNIDGRWVIVLDHTS